MNFKIKNPDKILSLIKRQYLPACIDHSSVDGVSLEFIDWRFNLRKSNTEALLRLNVECKDDILLLRKKITELSKVINSAN